MLIKPLSYWRRECTVLHGMQDMWDMRSTYLAMFDTQIACMCYTTHVLLWTILHCVSRVMTPVCVCVCRYCPSCCCCGGEGACGVWWSGWGWWGVCGLPRGCPGGTDGAARWDNSTMFCWHHTDGQINVSGLGEALFIMGQPCVYVSLLYTTQGLR